MYDSTEVHVEQWFPMLAILRDRGAKITNGSIVGRECLTVQSILLTE